MKNKKVKIVIVLLLLAVAGIVGTGAYSYYWTKGNFDTSGGYIRTNKRFDPQGLKKYDEEYDSYNMDFLGDGGDVKLVCSDEDADGYRTCTGYSPISNDGNVRIIVSHSNFELHSDGDTINVSSITPTYKWVYEDNNGYERVDYSETFELNEGKSATLVTTFKIKVGTGSTAHEVTAPVIGNTENLTMSIDLKATQYHYDY